MGPATLEERAVTAGLPSNEQFTAACSRKYHCACIGRNRRKRYAHSHEEVLVAFGRLIPRHEPIDSAFRAAIQAEA